jgi:hypothetical protein
VEPDGLFEVVHQMGVSSYLMNTVREQCGERRGGGRAHPDGATIMMGGFGLCDPGTS